jgi:hypothetical protein
MRLLGAVAAVLVALGAASAASTWDTGAAALSGHKSDRIARVARPASWQGPYQVGVMPAESASGNEVVVRNRTGVPVYVSDPESATTTVMRDIALPSLDRRTVPSASLDRDYAAATIGIDGPLQTASR